MYPYHWIACVPVLLASPAPLTTQVPLTQRCPNLTVHEPVVLYEVTGSTLAGPYDRSLVVYNDGLARLSSAGDQGELGSAKLAFVSPEGAQALQRDLDQAGAFKLCDDSTTVSDVPLSTLTVFRAGSDVQAHTFSWWSTNEFPYEMTDKVLSDFIATYFPGS